MSLGKMPSACSRSKARLSGAKVKLEHSRSLLKLCDLSRRKSG